MKGELTISRPSFGDGRKKITISIKDSDSRNTFVELEIDYDKFAACLTGLSYQEVDFDVRGLDLIGKTKETKTFIFKIPRANYMMDKQEVIDIGEGEIPEGWRMSKYFNSQNSFFVEDDIYYARTSIYRYVEGK